MQQLFDSHVHSDCSPDGHHSVTTIASRAQEMGLPGFAVTDHCEVNAYYTENYDKRMKQSAFEIRKARAVFEPFLTVAHGVELGQPLQDLKASAAVLQLYDYDFILASVHNNKNEEDFYVLEYNDFDQTNALLERYFTECLETARWNGFDSFAHLTYPMRYILKKRNDIDLSRFDGITDEFLRVLAANAKALEINTSSLRRDNPEFLCYERYSRRFKELGGRYITIGSDAHNATDIGAGLREGVELIKSLGYTHYARYIKRCPIEIPI